MSDTCVFCNKDLAGLAVIQAAEGNLYCSRTCGIHDFTAMYGDSAPKHFDDASELVNPADIM